MFALYSEVLIPRMLGWRNMTQRQDDVGFISKVSMEIVVSICTMIISLLIYSAKSNFDTSLENAQKNILEVSSNIEELNNSVEELTIQTKVSVNRIERMERRIESVEEQGKETRKEFRAIRGALNETRSSQGLSPLQ